MKRALVFSGGGSRGAYQCGAWQALRELNIRLDGVYGTSIGAVNAALVAQGDFDVALKLSSSFGGGMGRMREVCGAVSGMLMVAGIKYGYNSPSDDVSKAEHYRLVQELANEFKEKHDSIICRELLNLNVEIDSPEPSPRTAEYYKTRSCADFVYDAAEIIENYMNNR